MPGKCSSGGRQPWSTLLGIKIFANERVENASVKKWQFTRDMGRDPWAKGPAWVKGKG